MANTEKTRKKENVLRGTKSTAHKTVVREKVVEKEYLVNKEPGKVAAKIVRGKKAVSTKEHVKPVKRTLTKRILRKAAATGFTLAAAKTMEVMGENLIVKSGWVVRKLANGQIERIVKVKTSSAFKID